jgi:hypothetical protein
MKRITVSVDENIDLSFRKLASQRFRFQRGWYSEAVMEAMELWINQVKSENNELGDFCDTGLELWKIIEDDTRKNDISSIIDYVIGRFTEDIVYAEQIKYKVKNDHVEIFPKNTQRENITKLINVKNGIVDFNCPITLTIEAALSDLTGKHYNVVSSEFPNHSRTILNSVPKINSKI